jgi:hypothetical protein
VRRGIPDLHHILRHQRRREQKQQGESHRPLSYSSARHANLVVMCLLICVAKGVR